ncbi:MAG: hypothetical protein HPY55_12050 [Firmicutes bacterium]|nr:hypothetical protein [Bacillota bacterium]
MTHADRKVFKGRLLADGMWAVHLLWGSWSMASLGGGLWMCCLSSSQPDGLAFAGLMFLCFSILPLLIWGFATRPIVLLPDGVRIRNTVLGSTLAPYEEIVFLGAGSEGLVMTQERDSRVGRVRRNISLPRWVASHEGFLEELNLRSPRLQIRKEGLRKYSIMTFTWVVFLLWITVGVAISPGFYVPSWQASLSWLGPRGLAAIEVGGFVGCMIYMTIAQKRCKGP